MLIIQKLSYLHPNRELLFGNIDLAVNRNDKIALIGNNGTGKSTLLKIIAGALQATAGQVQVTPGRYYVPQAFGQYNHLTIAAALKIDAKLHALKAIMRGDTAAENYERLNDDWMIEERSREALSYWQLADLDLNQKLGTLSGGQKTRVFLAGIAIHQPELILLDEPSNHLDAAGRALLYDFIQSSKSTLIIVSHDRKLLSLISTTAELNGEGITIYGGNYDFYAEQKQIERNALNDDIQDKEKALRKAKEKERATIERQQRSDARGKGKQEKAGIARIMMNTLRNSAENSTAKMKGVHAEKIGGISKDLQTLRASLPDIDKMKFGFNDSTLHKGKILFSAGDINFSYGSAMIWKKNLRFQITSGERLTLKGANGSGKTTLINIILGNLQPTTGSVYNASGKTVYIDQEYSLIDNRLNVYEQSQQFNTSALQEHEIKIRLSRFLFTKEDWNKPCGILSGGERMRLALCCLTIQSHSPDIIVLDEPTNNLDIQNIEIMTAALNEYKGTLIVVSHDETFLEQINIERAMLL